MAKITIDVGDSPNSGTGDTIRDAMISINQNFDEIYSTYIMTGPLTVGNSTVNSVVSNTGLITGNNTVNSVANSINFKISNSIYSSILSVGSLSIGNSTVNTFHGTTSLYIANSTSNTTLSTGSLFVGNSTVNAFANSSYLKIASANITSNTLTLGSSTDSANGYTYLPNGFKMNWGVVSANDSVGQITFSSAFSTNAYVVTATSNATGTYTAAVISQNSTGAEIRTSNASATDVYFNAIGK